MAMVDLIQSGVSSLERPGFARAGVTWLCMLGVCLTVGISPPQHLVHAQENAGPARSAEEKTQWIWDSDNATSQTEAGPVYFRLKISNDSEVRRGSVVIQCDNRYTLWWNGVRLGAGDQWQVRDQYEVTQLIEGENILAVEASNDANSPAGLAVAVVMATANGNRYWYSGEAAWMCSRDVEEGWMTSAAGEQEWKPAVALGELPSTAPWAGQLDMDRVQQKAVSIVRRPTQENFSLLPSDRLTLVGSGFVEQLQWNGSLEAWLYQALSTGRKGISIRNLGWGGDDVHGTARAVFGSPADGRQRLLEDLARTEPTVVLLCYGANESFAGEAGLSDFEKTLRQLAVEMGENGTQVVLATPPPFFTKGDPLPDMTEANQRLKTYCEAIRRTGAELKLPVIDLNRQMTSTQAKAGTDLTQDGVHLNSEGQRMASEYLFEGLLPSAKPRVPTTELVEMVRRKNEFYFHRYRPQNETYLFLFRKHEQGNNAVEIPQFDGLVEELENKIHRQAH